MNMVQSVDNDSYMLGTHTRKALSEEERAYFDWRFTDANGGTHPATCPTCGRKTDPDFLGPDFRLVRRRFDLSRTYDGYTVASSSFREACFEEHGIGLAFEPIPAEPGFFVVRATRALAVDRSAPGLRFLLPCPRCHEFAGVFGTSHLRVPDADADAVGWWRSDLAFAQAHEQAPVLLVGGPTTEWLRQRRFKGLKLSALPA